jgi:predicted transcriptional regulator
MQCFAEIEEPSKRVMQRITNEKRVIVLLSPPFYRIRAKELKATIWVGECERRKF